MAELEMVAIPAGRFRMGSVEGDQFATAEEGPPRMLEVGGFLISRHPVAEDESALPRVNVSWDEAQAYCRNLGDGYRLPSEVEWEYACRAGSATSFTTIDEPDPSKVNYLYDEQGSRIGIGRRLPNGWGKPNAFGLHDMLGNVCEWVNDCWQHGHPDMKVIRGGAWDYMPRLVRPSWRDFAMRSTRRDNLGFRVCRDL
jgi:formylglycine-generating enzyme required for sulfatase activity